jgi:heme-degrading monooxygenase HmoA
MSVRVMAFAAVHPGQEADFESAFRTVAAAVAGTAGHIRDELLRDRERSDQYVFLSEWESAEAFLAWVNAPIHREQTTPMRPYWAGRVQRTIFDIVARPDGALIAPSA